LELSLTKQPELLQHENEHLDLALRTTKALVGLLGEGARNVTFGIGEEKDLDDQSPKNDDIQPLPWAQLSEITKCLAVRNMLPPEITNEDQIAISSNAAWRWYTNLRNARLSYLAMGDMVRLITENIAGRKSVPKRKKLWIYSAHDSTLIGLMCAFRLEQPTEWPEYASFLKIEVLTAADEKEYYLRFSLNGKLLKSYLEKNDDEKGDPHSIIPLSTLQSIYGI